MYWLHSVDQIIYDLGAKCFTETEFFRLMKELLDDRLFSVVSATSESLRQASAVAYSSNIASDKREHETAVLKAKSVVLENKARSTVAQPAYDAALIEIQILTNILQKNSFTMADYYRIQRTEAVLSLAYDYFIDGVHGIESTDTVKSLSARGVVVSSLDTLTSSVLNDEGVNLRDFFLKEISSILWPDGSASGIKLVTSDFLHGMYEVATNSGVFENVESLTYDDLSSLCHETCEFTIGSKLVKGLSHAN